MSASHAKPRQDSAGEAITRILRAEQAAEAGVAEAERRAAQEVSLARARAVAIAARADQRVAALNALCRRTTARAIEQIDEESTRTLALSTRSIPDGAVRRAVDRTVRFLLDAEEPP